MNLHPPRVVLNTQAFTGWLGIASGADLAGVPEDLIGQVTVLVRGLRNHAWLAIDRSLNNWFKGLQDLSLPRHHRRLAKLIHDPKLEYYGRLYESAPHGWQELSPRLSEASHEIIIFATPALFRCKPGEEHLEVLRGQMRDLMKDSLHLDLYDPYLIGNLLGASRIVDPSLSTYSGNAAQTLAFLADALDVGTEKKTINIKCPLKSNAILGTPSRFVPESPDSIYEQLGGLKEVLMSIVKRHEGRVHFTVDIRRAASTSYNGRMDMRREWFHGRYIVLPGACVVSSDRSLDFVGKRETSNGGVSESRLGLLDNMLARWSIDTFGPEELVQHFNELRSEFPGPPIVVGESVD